MEYIFKRRKSSVNFIKVASVFLLSLICLTCLFPLYFITLPNFDISTDFYLFIVFPLVGLIIFFPFMGTRKALKIMKGQLLKISPDEIEVKLISHYKVSFSKIKGIQQKRFSIKVLTSNGYFYIGDFEKQKEIKNLLEKFKEGENTASH